MNNNRNNRRRGRGNRSTQGGGNNQNRIDSRARGNAPQLLDKYKKLAQDAQHNGDRVQAEYYLQFADHYFRVIADNKARQDEARAKRNDSRGDDRNQANDDSDGDESDKGRKNNRRSRSRRDDDFADQGASGVEGEVASDDEEAVKPKRRARKPKADAVDADGDDAPRRKPRANSRAKKSEKKSERADGPSEIDSSVLPPSISASVSSDDDDSLEAVG